MHWGVLNNFLYLIFDIVVHVIVFFQKHTGAINFQNNLLVTTARNSYVFCPLLSKIFQTSFSLFIVLFSHGKYSGSVDTDFMLLEGGDIKIILSFRELQCERKRIKLPLWSICALLDNLPLPQDPSYLDTSFSYNK